MASKPSSRSRGEGRLFQRGRIWWIAYSHRGEEIRESSRSEDERVAKKLLRERLRTAGTAAFVGPQSERVSFGDLERAFLDDLRVNARRSIRDAEKNTRELRAFFGTDRAVDITSDRVATYVRYRLDSTTRLGGAPKPATINRELACLRRMFILAQRTGRLPTRPHIALLAEDNARQGFFEPAEFAAVCAALRADLVDVAMFAYLTGWRVGAIRSLEWRDVRFESAADEVVGGTVSLRAENSKNKRPNVIALRGTLLELIVRRASLRRLASPFVFHREGRAIGDFRRAWGRACEAAGLTGRTFHDLRRSAVRNMVRAGVPERVAMAISGHRTRSVFDRYNIVSDRDVTAAMDLTLRYVDERSRETPAVVPLRAVAGELGQNSDNRAGLVAVDRARRPASPRNFKSHPPESNRRPTDYESVALPTELGWPTPDDRRTRRPPTTASG